MKVVKKILIIDAILLALSIVLFTATTIAYFTSQKKVSATFTSGDVRIALSQAAVKKDSSGNLIEDATQPRVFGSVDGTPYDYGMIFPGQSIYKDPTIRNVGANEAYIAARVTISDGAGDIHRLLGYDNADYIDTDTFISGSLLDEDDLHFGEWNGIQNVTHNDHFAMMQVPDVRAGEYHLYFFILSPMKQNEEIELFDTLHFFDEWTGEDMKEFRDLRIDVVAFGVQTFGFNSCYDAMTSAFPSHFSGITQMASQN